MNTGTASTVVIAVDGTESDKHVIRTALDLFGDTHRYVVVNVSDEPAMLGAASVSYASASAFAVPALSQFADGLGMDADAAEDVADAAAATAGLSDAESVGLVGDPATVLLDVAAERGAAVIAIGSSERSWLSRLFDPSVEAAVVDRATCPVLVVHPDPNAD